MTAKRKTGRGAERAVSARFAGDALPSNPVACAVAIADKMEHYGGYLWYRSASEGDKDPFALRRAALGVLRIIVEEPDLDLQTLTEEAVRLYGEADQRQRG